MIDGPSSRPADIVLRAGRIHAEVDARPDGTAIAIADGRVLAVGSDLEIAGLIGPRTEVRDLAGRTVLPGLTDSHTHLHRAALVRRLYLDFADLAPTTIDDVLGHVARRATGLEPDAWIQGDSLTASGLAEGRLPARHELDRAAAGRPVVLRGIGKHVIAASSAALRAAGIDSTTPDPPGGRIDRDQTGEPTGILHERAKLRLDSSDPATVVPQANRDERLSALRAVFGDVQRLGITTIHEMIRLSDEADDLASLHASGELPLRVRLWYRVHESTIRLEHLASLGIRRGLGDDWFRVLGVKVSVDGWCIFRNAAVHEPYLNEPTNRGLLRIEPDELARLTVAANARGLGVAVHAVGSRAVDAALAAFATAGPATAGPYRLEHGHLDMDERRLLRMRDLDVAWSVQPSFLPAYRADWEAALEPTRVDAILPLATAATLGIPILHNSDVPSGPQDPIGAVHAAVTRRAGPRSIGTDQTISPTLAWRGWTTVPAWSAGEPRLGRLRPGYAADMIVVSGEPFVVTIADEAPTVVATMIEGRFVHGGDGTWRE